MVAPVFTDVELESLRRFPEIVREELFRFFTLTRRTVRSSAPLQITDHVGDTPSSDCWTRWSC